MQVSLYEEKNIEGNVERYKTRLVKNYSTIWNWLWWNIFSNRSNSICSSNISIGCFLWLWVVQIDVKTAFLNGYLDEEIYMEQLEC